MALSEKDLKGFVEEVTKARELLAKKGEVEREIATQERRLGKLQTEFAETEGSLIRLRNDIADAQNRYEHEKKRYAADLGRVVGECGAQKAEAEKAKGQALASVDQDMHAYRARMASERSQLDKDLRALREERAAILALNRDIKARLHALPE